MTTLTKDPESKSLRDSEAAFEAAWSELAPMLTALAPAHLEITRRIGHILFGDGMRCGMDAGAGIALSVLDDKMADIKAQRHVTVVSGASYHCILHANEAVEVVQENGDLLATAKWNTTTGEHDDAMFASCDNPITYDRLLSILAHASEAWRKHRR